MTELEIIVKDLRKEMLPEETNKLDGQKAEFFKNLDAKYPGIFGTIFKETKLEPKVEPKAEPETDNIGEIIDELLEFFDRLVADEDAEENETKDVEEETLEDGSETNDCDDCGDCDLCDRYDEEPELDFERIEFHNPATIVFWNDGTKTVVKARHGDKFDKEKGLAMAIAKKVMGNTNKYYDVFEEFCFDEDTPDEDTESLDDVMERFGIVPNETDARTEEKNDLDGNSVNEEETVAEPVEEEKSTDEEKPVKDEKPKKVFGLKRGKKQD